MTDAWMMMDDDAWMITRMQDGCMMYGCMMDDVWNPRDADITKGKNNNLLTDFHANVLLPREQTVPCPSSKTYTMTFLDSVRSSSPLRMRFGYVLGMHCPSPVLAFQENRTPDGRVTRYMLKNRCCEQRQICKC